MGMVIVMRGPSGVGKSHYVKENCPGAVVCSADEFFWHMAPRGLDPRGSILPFELRDGRYYQYQFDATKLPQAHCWCFDIYLRNLCARKELVVVDNTSIPRWEYEHYLTAADLAGYDTQVVDLCPETRDAMRMCVERNTHGVPATIIARKCLEFEYHPGSHRPVIR